MSSQTRASADTGDEQDLMDIDSDPGARSASASTSSENNGHLAMVLQDSASWLPKVKALKETELIILLAPVVKPEDSSRAAVSDPFEPLGRALAKWHLRIRHVPYISKIGLTSTHLAFIQRGHAIILCLTAEPSGETPFEHAEVLFGAHEHKPSIIIVCSSSAQESRRIRHLQNIPFPTIILTTGHSPAALEAAASLIYNSPSPKLAHLLQPTSPSPQPRGASPYQAPYRPATTTTTTTTTVGVGTPLPHVPTWPITLFDPATDGPSIHALWTECLPARFSLPPTTLSALLHRPGYSKHYTVHSPSDHSIIGFCATYLTYADRAGEDLIASLAILLVRRDARGRGIGGALHDHSLRELARTRGVTRFQLGSTFPRLLAGPLVSYGGGNLEGELEEAREAPEEEWFQRRGWEMRNPKVPGQGGHTVDMVLDMRAWRPVPSRGSGMPELAASTSSSSASSLSSSFGTGEVRFRSAMQDDMRDVLEIVDTAAKKIGKMGWFDQYAALMNGTNVKDVVLGVDVVRRRIAAVALTYTPSCGTQVLANLPWAGRMGDDVGGVTCICIPDPQDAPHIFPQLLDACVQALRSSGMSRMFLDSIGGGVVKDLKQLGFREWASYKDVWRNRI